MLNSCIWNISGSLCFEKRKPYLGGLAIFHKPLVCEGLQKIAKPHKFGFSFWKQRIPKIFQMQLFSTGPVVHLGVVQSTWNFGSRPKIGIYEHFIFYILSFWPTVTALVTPLLWAVHSVTVSLRRQLNVVWAPEDPLNAWNVIPIHFQGAQGHFGSHLTHLKWPIAV